MAVSLLCSEVSDLCIGKPALRSLPPKSTVGDALQVLKRCGESGLRVWSADRSSSSRICMVDVICYLCADDNIGDPTAALKGPVSELVSYRIAGLVRQVEPHSCLLDAIDLILDGAKSLVVPIGHTSAARKKLSNQLGSGVEFCWLTLEDFVRYFLNSIAFFSSVSALSVTALGLVRTDILTVDYREPALSAVPLICAAITDQTSVAVTDDGKLIGEISPSTLSSCDETVIAALAVLSAGDLLAYIDCYGSLPECAVLALKGRLKEKGMEGMLELMYEENSSTLLFPCPSMSSSSDEESVVGRRRRPRRQRSGSYTASMARGSEAIVCHPGSSLVVVMMQAVAHRVSYAWVVEDDYELVGIVALSDVLKVLRDQL